jgi:RNA polymerase sigma-70 factor (ECF subfamily)
MRQPSAAADARFNEVFAAHRSKVLALCLHLTGRRAEAEDAVQETFLAVHRALPEFRGESQISTWIYRIAVRSALSVRAKRRVSEPIPEELPDSAPLPDEAADARRSTERLAVALESLGAEHRAVLSLFAVEGLSHSEIAAVLGIPEGTVWSRLHLARKQLAKALGRARGATDRP